MRALATLLLLLGLGVVGACRSVQTPEAAGSVARATVTPFLMFQDGRAEEAVKRYIEVFGVGSVVFIKRYGPNEVGREGSIMQAVFEIHGQRIMLTESPIKHVFDFNPAISFFVDFDSREELDRVFAALTEGGEVMMPLNNYGFSERFAFIQDRFGVSWQLNLPSK